MSRIGIRRRRVWRRRRLIQARRQTETGIHLDLEGHTSFALNSIIGVGEEVVRAFDGQRHLNDQWLVEVGIAAVVLNRVVVGGVIEGAALECCQVVGLDHGLIRIRPEDCNLQYKRNNDDEALLVN